jgi:hypothetical protein
MAETKEKAAKKRTAAKPKAAIAKKALANKEKDVRELNAAAYIPTHEEIAFLALQYWEERGRAHGEHVQDWLRAEQDLVKMAS